MTGINGMFNVKSRIHEELKQVDWKANTHCPGEIADDVIARLEWSGTFDHLNGHELADAMAHAHDLARAMALRVIRS